MNVKIRKITKNDTANIIKWRNNIEVLKYFIDQRLLTEETHNNWLTNYVEKGLVEQFIICWDNIDVGSVFLKNIDNIHKYAEYGIFIGDTCCRGMGVGSKASKLILEFGFNSLKLDEIYLRVRSNNTKAIKVYEKLGFNKTEEVEGITFMNIKKENFR